MTRLHKLTVSEMVRTEYWVGAKDEDDAIRKFLARDSGVVKTKVDHSDRSSARIESVEPEDYQRRSDAEA